MNTITWYGSAEERSNGQISKRVSKFVFTDIALLIAICGTVALYISKEVPQLWQIKDRSNGFICQKYSYVDILIVVNLLLKSNSTLKDAARHVVFLDRTYDLLEEEESIQLVEDIIIMQEPANVRPCAFGQVVCPLDGIGYASQLDPTQPYAILRRGKCCLGRTQ